VRQDRALGQTGRTTRVDESRGVDVGLHGGDRRWAAGVPDILSLLIETVISSCWFKYLNLTTLNSTNLFLVSNFWSNNDLTQFTWNSSPVTICIFIILSHLLSINLPFY
jgi:hypothetical protein